MAKITFGTSGWRAILAEDFTFANVKIAVAAIAQHLQKTGEASKGVVVLGISVDKDPQAYQKFLSRYTPAFLTARDFKIHEEYGTFMYPETYIIDAKGRVVLKIAEAADWSDPKMTQYIDSLL